MHYVTADLLALGVTTEHCIGAKDLHLFNIHAKTLSLFLSDLV